MITRAGPFQCHSALAAVPAISRANASISSDQTGSEQTGGRFNPRRARFAPRERALERFSGRCWPAHSRDWPRSCGRSSSLSAYGAKPGCLSFVRCARRLRVSRLCRAHPDGPSLQPDFPNARRILRQYSRKSAGVATRIQGNTFPSIPSNPVARCRPRLLC